MTDDEHGLARPERVLRGTGVTAGIAIAPVHAVPSPSPVSQPAGTPGDEARRLDEALLQAAQSLEHLASNLDQEAAAILEFQIMLLEDDDLLTPTHAAIGEGASAGDAWRSVMDGEAATYREGDDPVFAARAADLEDLRDRVLACLSGDGEDPLQPTEASILVARDLPPSRLLELDPAKVAGIALGEGSRTSHVVLLARARGIPMLTGLGALEGIESVPRAVLDVNAGSLILNPGAATLATARRSVERLAEQQRRWVACIGREIRIGNQERVSICVNIDHESLLGSVSPEHCDGIGLARTELLFDKGPPDEDRQLAVYARLLRWAQGRTVTIRTLDAGGDKPVPGLEQPMETNPFLGLRGVRLTLSRPAVFKTQLRALLRAAALGRLKIMVPMVTDPAELTAVRHLLDEAELELRAEGVEHARPELGMMVEVPAAALCAGDFDVDFYSIGSNDLIQYATACARDNPSVAALARSDHPGVIALIEAVIAAGRRLGREVSVCGEMASEPADACRLVHLGVRALSVAPSMLGPVKAALLGAVEQAER